MWDSETDQIFKVSYENAIVLKVKPGYLNKVKCANDEQRCWVTAIACNWMGNRSFIVERKQLIPITVADLPLYLNYPYIEPLFYEFIKGATL